jgi:CRISPR-associated protein Csc2
MPLPQDGVVEAMERVVPELLREDGVVYRHIAGERLQRLLQEVLQITSDEQKLLALLTQANAEANRYAQNYGVGAKEAKGKK